MALASNCPPNCTLTSLVAPTTPRYAPGMKPPQKKWIFWGCLLIPVLAPLTFICLMGLNVFHAHEHCIKQAGLAFHTYARDHDGRLPYDTNGFGNALLLLVKGGYLGDIKGVNSIGPVTGPGDQGAGLQKSTDDGRTHSRRAMQPHLHPGAFRNQRSADCHPVRQEVLPWG